MKRYLIRFLTPAGKAEEMEVAVSDFTAAAKKAVLLQLREDCSEVLSLRLRKGDEA